MYIAEKITIITILQHRKDAGTTLLRWMSGPPNIYTLIFQQLATDALKVGPAHEMPCSTFTVTDMHSQSNA